jgi:predicted Zn-dependent protease
MKRQLIRFLRQLIRRVFPFGLGLLLVVGQLIPAIAQSPPKKSPEPAPTATPEPTFSVPGTEPPVATPAPTPDPEAAKLPEIVKPPTPEELQRLSQLTEADRLYNAGDKPAAIALYRQLKPDFAGVVGAEPVTPAIADIAQMPPAAQVYWREGAAGLAAKLEGRTFVPLQLLVQKHPEFIPGHLQLAQAYAAYGRPEEALAVLQSASSRYPNDTELLKLRVAALAQNKKWIEGAIAARQFALLNPTHPQAAEFTQLADVNLQTYRRKLKQQLTGNVIGNVITGALGYALTGSLLGPLNSVQTSFLLMRGESALGDSVVRQAKRELELVTDEETNKYVTEIGMKLAAVAGREDFKYEFFVVEDEALNAFALPGGKVFVNAGAIAKTKSEAELAGLLGHEISHAVLAHGLQLMTQGSLTANVTQFIPYVGGIAESVITFGYSRDMERQADAVGTRLLASAGYAADGLWNLTHALKREEAADKTRSRPPEWLSTHPGGDERLKNIEQLITKDGYDRYAYEGVERHTVIQQKMIQQLQAAAVKAEEAKKGKKQRKGTIVDKRKTKTDKPEDRSDTKDPGKGVGGSLP